MRANGYIVKQYVNSIIYQLTSAIFNSGFIKCEVSQSGFAFPEVTSLDFQFSDFMILD